MAWFRVDDQAAFHAKILMAGNEAFGALVRAGAWSSAHGTDGLIPRAVALTIAPARVWRRLVEAKLHDGGNGLAVETPSGWQIHDYLAWNPSAEQVRSERARKAANVASFRARKQGVTSRVTDDVTGNVAGSKSVRNHGPIPIPIPKPDLDPPQSPPLADGGREAPKGPSEPAPESQDSARAPALPPSAPGAPASGPTGAALGDVAAVPQTAALSPAAAEERAAPRRPSVRALELAYREAMAQAQGRPYHLPFDELDRQALETFAETAADPVAELRESVAAYHRARRGEGKYERGFRPSKWAEWRVEPDSGAKTGGAPRKTKSGTLIQREQVDWTERVGF